jgi:hypothetical protein
MNERIRELYITAMRGDCGEKWDTQEEFIERFAELIVKECADIAKHHVMNISTYADADFIEKQITENFGVKE